MAESRLEISRVEPGTLVDAQAVGNTVETGNRIEKDFSQGNPAGSIERERHPERHTGTRIDHERQPGPADEIGQRGPGHQLDVELRVIDMSELEDPVGNGRKPIGSESERALELICGTGAITCADQLRSVVRFQLTANGLAARRHDVDLVAQSLEPAEGMENVAGVSIFGRAPNDIRKQRLLSRIEVAGAGPATPAPHQAEEECSFRRRAATSESLKKRARAHGTLIDLVLRELAAVNVKIPDYTIPSIAARDPNAIERAAERCRGAWKIGMGPIKHIGRVAEGNGVVLIRHLRHADKIDAFARRGARNIIVLNPYRTSTSRWVYDVAHELGHFVLHEGVETGSKETEDQANLFAGAVLLPRRSFAREFAARPFSWGHVMQLKQRWVVSASAIIRRAFELALIHPIAYRRHYQYMSARGWLKREPNEPEFVGPEWLKSAFALARDRFGVTPAALADRLHLTAETFSKSPANRSIAVNCSGSRRAVDRPRKGCGSSS